MISRTPGTAAFLAGFFSFLLLHALAASAGTATTSRSPATSPGALSAADAKSLDQLFANGLFDPTGARFVRFKLTLRDVWMGSYEREVRGWLVEPKDPRKTGDIAWAILISGEAVPAASAVTAGDFVADCRAIMDRPATRPATVPSDDPFVRMRRISRAHRPDTDPLPAPHLAAWLHRLGHDDLAARMLARASDVEEEREEQAVDSYPRMNPWHWYSSGVHAYMVRADGEALFYLRRLREYFPDSLKKVDDARGDGHFPEAVTLMADLERRHKEGTLGRQPEELPADFGKWPVERRISHLIGQLDEVDARQHGQPGGVDLAGDARVKALIDIGEPAVPALLDCLEKDERLTRSVHFFRDFAESRTVVAVREAALNAVMSILRTSVFEPRATGDNFTGRGDDEQKQVVQQLRNYWKTYGHMPFDERMMNILTDEKATQRAWREAASNLARLGAGRTIGTTIGTNSAAGRDPTVPNPVIAKFKGPTVAEAILGAMDRDLARNDAGEHDDLHDYHREEIESAYIDALAALADRAIAPALVKRLDSAPSVRMRRLLAAVCFNLGESRPLALFADDVRAGRIVIPDKHEGGREGDRADSAELRDIVQALSAASARLPAADAALNALADPRHPLYPIAVRNVRVVTGWDERVWLSHPFALRILAGGLADTRPGGTTYKVSDDKGNLMLHAVSPGMSSSSSVPDSLVDPAVRREKVEALVCDTTAEKLSGLILGVPYCHPLLKDSEKRREDLKAFLDAHIAHLRLATYPEASTIGSSFDVQYILDIRRLTKGATAEDVARGQAIFHLDGKGVPLEGTFPAKATLKSDRPPAGKEPTRADVQAGRAREFRVFRADDEEARVVIEWRTRRVLIMQAERAPDGKVHYGIVSRDEMRHVTEDELTEIKPLTTE